MCFFIKSMALFSSAGQPRRVVGFGSFTPSWIRRAHRLKAAGEAQSADTRAAPDSGVISPSCALLLPAVMLMLLLQLPVTTAPSNPPLCVYSFFLFFWSQCVSHHSKRSFFSFFLFCELLLLLKKIFSVRSFGCQSSFILTLHQGVKPSHLGK